jgi:hypothetical protein
VKEIKGLSSIDRIHCIANNKCHSPFSPQYVVQVNKLKPRYAPASKTRKLSPPPLKGRKLP